MYKFLILLLLLLVGLGCSDQRSTETVRFGICADVHLPTMHDSEYRISTFIDSMKIARPDFIIELGDFGTPDPKYAHMFAIWNSYPGKKYHVIGNHEMDGGTSLQQALAYRNMTASYYAFDEKGFHFIVLDGNDKKNPDEKGYRQYIGPLQQDWLRKELQNAIKPVIIFSHQGMGIIDGMDNAAEMRAILEQHNSAAKENRIIACFNGHYHNDSAEEINGIWYVCINSMSYKWLGEEYPYVRYSQEVDQNFKWIKYTAPYKDPLFAVVEISKAGTIRIKGRKSEWVGPSPWELGYPEEHKAYIAPRISDRELQFRLNE
jgi:Icc protein